MGKLKLTLACEDYDRTRALLDGSIQVEGVDLNYLPLSVEEIFWRMLRHEEFDASEMSLSSYTLAVSRGDNRFIALPVFTSRSFRHSCLYVHAGSGITRPEDLRGKRVGVPEYQITAAVWVRGLLEHEYGVNPSELRWVTGGEEQPGRVEKLPLELPPGVSVEPAPPGKALSPMLETGELDALVAARLPSCIAAGSPKVRRLFPGYRELEEDYFRRTGIFPIMHTVVLRRSLYERHPWVAQGLYKAFCQAKEAVYRRQSETASLFYTLPWQVHEVEATRSLMGQDFWPYGLGPNRETLGVFLAYSREQGLCRKELLPQDLFASEAVDAFLV